MSHRSTHLYEFGPFRLDEQERLLLRAGESVSLTPKAFDMLLVLVEQHGHLLEKEALFKAAKLEPQKLAGGVDAEVPRQCAG